MSASPMARTATSGQDIPSRRVVITNEEDMPSDYGTTPGGTIFGTTPGGTRIVYERAFLINMRNSPLAKTPPQNLPQIPGVTVDFTKKPEESEKKDKKSENHSTGNKEDDDQFSMDI
uniref:Eukaryotic translation initiation factor 4e-binding protein 1 n=1 Tax=Pseudodiaptomus poplesia TaxID=213370 RepID=A0A1S6GL56_9MAXI|nr:eukaryotic translation initiation factor 4e-binding protein 1 [Pseudodiaptomus poplesia]